ncbi:MAG TPA: TatD family deoxyribonuclease [Candidatus Yonathbacteria bacterium]|nr:TatD family deoxyribonuclease [Candidatus Yonathbacteria bacterium]
MSPEFIDIHAHLQDRQFDSDREGKIVELKRNNIWSIQIGTDNDTSREAVALSREYENLFASIGIHPVDKKDEIFSSELFEGFLGIGKVVAIGECGLDYFYFKKGELLDTEKERQEKLFTQQLEFAIAHDLPIMIHCRPAQESDEDAHMDMLAILSKKRHEYGDKLRGNIHFFTSTKEIARKYFELGFTLSFSGVITFAQEYDEVVRSVPLEMIMSETDSPYAAPVPFRGKRNEPAYVEEVVRKIAELRNEDLEVVKKTLVGNAKRVFGLR